MALRPSYCVKYFPKGFPFEVGTLRASKLPSHRGARGQESVLHLNGKLLIYSAMLRMLRKRMHYLVPPRRNESSAAADGLMCNNVQLAFGRLRNFSQQLQRHSIKTLKFVSSFLKRLILFIESKIAHSIKL